MSKPMWAKNSSRLSPPVSHNKRKLSSDCNPEQERKCSCPKKVQCPLEGECLASNIIYQATVTCGDEVETYVGLTATNFKTRYANHKASFTHQSKSNATELSNHIWRLKEKNLRYAITWKILCHAPPYTNTSKRCALCLNEKYYIICKPDSASLNKKKELVNKCRHKDRFLLRNVK